MELWKQLLVLVTLGVGAAKLLFAGEQSGDEDPFPFELHRSDKRSSGYAGVSFHKQSGHWQVGAALCAC